jgi:predicted DNA-binding protein YlxM (UPF0122 family)
MAPYIWQKGSAADDARREYVGQMYSEGFSCRQIGEKLGVTKQAVWAMLKRMDVPMRGPGGYQR